MNNFYKYMRRHFIKIAQNRIELSKLHLFLFTVSLITDTQTPKLYL